MKYKQLILGAVLISSALSTSAITDEDNNTTLSTRSYKEDIAKTDDPGTYSSDERLIIEKWISLEKIFRSFTSQAVKIGLRYLLRWSEELDISSKCSRGIMKTIYGIKQMKTWAFRRLKVMESYLGQVAENFIQITRSAQNLLLAPQASKGIMLDSSGKIPNGILTGHFSTLGDFDGCLSAIAPEPNSFRGQYCSVFIRPPLPKRKIFQNVEELLPVFVNFTKEGTVMQELTAIAQFFNQLQPRTSVCVPSTCSREEIQTIVNKIVDLTEFPWNVSVPTCDVKESTVFIESDIAIICVLSVIVFVAFLATITDVVLRLSGKEKRLKMEVSSTGIKCLMCFSAYTNTLRLLKKDSSQDSIKIFHGMKVITLLWVMLNHTYYYTNFNLHGSMTNARGFGKEIAFQLVANGFLNVETFFFISAVLLAYGRMKFSGRDISIAVHIFRRIWRLTPPLMLVIATSMLVPHFGSGPGWKETVDTLIDRCKANWWANLVFINNFLNSEDMCFDWLWYIPVDTHLYILGLFVIAPMKSRPKLSLGLNAVLFTAGTLISAASHIYYQQQPTAIYVYSDRQDIRYYTDNSYFRSYTHITTCSIGLYVGYILAERPKFKIPKILNIFGWLSSIILALVVLYGVYDWNQGNVPGLLVSTLYMCTNKVVWALALGYVTIACLTGNGGIITKVLSWSVFVPLGRLTYAAYLIHPILLYLYVGSIKAPPTLDHRTLVYRYLGNTVLTYIVAYVVSLLFESPFMCLEKAVLFKRSPSGDAPVRSKPEVSGKFGNNLIFTEGTVVSTINIKKIESEEV